MLRYGRNDRNCERIAIVISTTGRNLKAKDSSTSLYYARNDNIVYRDFSVALRYGRNDKLFELFWFFFDVPFFVAELEFVAIAYGKMEHIKDWKVFEFL